MDSKSHELFAKVLLEYTGRKTSPKWGMSPDMDLKFLHRWYRHRISKLPEIYREFEYSVINSCEYDKDDITLCIISHLYLDIFNSWIFPFGIWHPVYPENTVINEVLDDLHEPNELIKDLETLTGFNIFSDMFYKESEGIFKEFINDLNIKYIESIIEIMVARLAFHSESIFGGFIYVKAMKDISKFTNNKMYNKESSDFMFDICKKFEKNYAFLINKIMSE